MPPAEKVILEGGIKFQASASSIGHFLAACASMQVCVVEYLLCSHAHPYIHLAEQILIQFVWK